MRAAHPHVGAGGAWRWREPQQPASGRILFSDRWRSRGFVAGFDHFIKLYYMANTTRASTVITVSLPRAILRTADRVAKEEGRTRSELVREALRVYAATRRWRTLRRWGEASARAAGIGSDQEIEEVVADVRRSRR